MTILTRVLLPSALLLLGGCAGLSPTRPQEAVEVNAPQAWLEAGRKNHGRISTGWLGEFRDPRMSQLVREAIAHNKDLQSAAHRLRAIREGTVGARAARLPSVSASG